MIVAIVLLAASLPAQGPQTAKADENLARMKAIASSYRFALDGDRAGTLQVGAEPAFRMGKQAAYDMTDGAIFLWAGDGGRPEAASQIYQVKGQPGAGLRWVQEFVSLSTGTFTATREGKPGWAPRRPGVEFRGLPDAPPPGETPTVRSRQMKALALDFKVSDDFKGRGFTELRLLPTPLAHYGKAGSGVLDGWLLAFAQGTDIEAFLLIEAREAPGGPEWNYAFAPMTTFGLKGTVKGQPAWDAPRRRSGDPSRPFYYLVLEDPPAAGKTPEEAPR